MALGANGRWSSWISGSDVVASGNTLPEHHSALALLQLMDRAWFQDNLLKPSCVGLVDAFLPFPSSQLLSPPNRSSVELELVDVAHSEWSASPSSQRPRYGSMPCARFETLSSSLAFCNIPDSGYAQVLDHWHHQPPPCAHALDVSLRSHTDTVLVPPPALQARFTKDLQNLKGFEANENHQAGNLKSVDHGKQLRVSLWDGKLPQPSLRLLGTKRFQRKNSKSMTACEFDELQGFMDLGFHFSQDDLTPRIVRKFPALRRKLEEARGSKTRPRTLLTKPIQSSVTTWLVRQSSAPLPQWQIPATREDMKERLKFWARAVASTVRQEC